MFASSTVENYVKQLYLQQGGGERQVVAVGRLAAAMGVVPGTATAMMKTLSDAKLVDYEPRGGVRLSASGEKLALHVLRRHRLLELFLVKTLGLDWAVVHDEADALEHAVSERVLEKIDALLGHPQTDPHGDPIPSAQGAVHEPPRATLADCPKGIPMRVVRVTNQDASFLKFIQRHGLMPQATVIVIDRETAAEAVILRTSARKEVSLGTIAAGHVQVEPVATPNAKGRMKE